MSETIIGVEKFKRLIGVEKFKRRWKNVATMQQIVSLILLVM